MSFFLFSTCHETNTEHGQILIVWDGFDQLGTEQILALKKKTVRVGIVPTRGREGGTEAGQFQPVN